MIAPFNAITAVLVAILLSACQPSTPLSARAAGREMVHDGVSRSYRVYAPDALRSRPGLLLVLHGWMGSGAEIERRTRYRFDRLADRDGVIVVYPDALAGQWHSGHSGETATSDDTGFLTALIDTLSRQYEVDPKRIHVTGFSNGASMTYRLACERPDRIASIAPVSGGLAVGLMQACADRSRRPIPLLLIHGTSDPVVAFDSGELEGNLAYWVRRNGCETTATVSHLADVEPGDGTLTRVEAYAGCSNGADVVLYAIEEGGHHWPDGDEPLRLQGRGRTERDFDGAAAVWDFVQAHPMP